jgi:uncharacterized protein (TIGR02271 family)
MTDKSRKTNPNADRDTNPDLITGAPGSHPIGAGVGAAGGGAAGAAIGSAVFPGIGTVVGAVVGAVAGGLAGKGVGEMVEPTGEREHWEKNYKARPYVEEGETFDAYRPAYEYGWESRRRHHGKTFDEAAPELERGWAGAHGNGGAGWDKAKHAVRDAWERVDEKLTPATGTTSTANTEPLRHSAAARDTTGLREGEQAIPVVEEELRVAKREVETGGVRVNTSMSERPVEARVDLREEHVRVERHRVDRPASGADLDAATRDGTIEVTETAEVAVVGKDARVVEEVVVGKEATERTETVRDTVRRTDVQVEQLDQGGIAASGVKGRERVRPN